MDGHKARGSNENIFANGSSKYESEDIVIHIKSQHGADSQTRQSMDSIIINSDDDIKQKEKEYENYIPANADNDQLVDMQLLALKAAEEFTVLANENDALFKENSTLKEKYDDMRHEKQKVEEELTALKHQQGDQDQIIDSVEILKSKAMEWEIEKKVLLEQLHEAQVQQQHGGGKKAGSRKGSDSLVGKTALKLKNDGSEDAQRLMMESLAKMTREKNELEMMMEKQRNAKRNYEETISDLRKQLNDTERDRQTLSSNLDQQQKMYLSLQESVKKKQMDLEGRARALTAEEEQKDKQEKQELLDAMDEQKAYIQQLESENQQLMQSKIHDDDQMFMELKQIRTHRFVRSMKLDDALSGLEYPESAYTGGGHSRAGSGSYSNASNSGMGYIHAFQPSGVELNFKMIREMNMDVDDGDINEDAEVEYDTHLSVEPTKSVADEPSTNEKDKEKKKVSFQKQEKEKAVTDKEKLKRKRMEQMQKMNAEIEFFLMTCIAIKANLVEEYPMKPEVLMEDPMKLFEIAQKEHVEMRKFNLWIELKLREKYELPKLEGFKKFWEKYHIKDKLEVTKQSTMKFASDIGQRIRAFSKGGGQSDNESSEQKEVTQTLKPPTERTIKEKEDEEPTEIEEQTPIPDDYHSEKKQDEYMEAADGGESQKKEEKEKESKDGTAGRTESTAENANSDGAQRQCDCVIL